MNWSALVGRSPSAYFAVLDASVAVVFLLEAVPSFSLRRTHCSLYKHFQLPICPSEAKKNKPGGGRDHWNAAAANPEFKVQVPSNTELPSVMMVLPESLGSDRGRRVTPAQNHRDDHESEVMIRLGRGPAIMAILTEAWQSWSSSVTGLGSRGGGPWTVGPGETIWRPRHYGILVTSCQCHGAALNQVASESTWQAWSRWRTPGAYISRAGHSMAFIDGGGSYSDHLLPAALNG